MSTFKFNFCFCVVVVLSQDGEILIGKLHLDTKLSWDLLSHMATDHFKVRLDQLKICYIFLLKVIFFSYFASAFVTCSWLDSVTVTCRTCNHEVAGSSPSRSTAI